jgi:hypothetical protein
MKRTPLVRKTRLNPVRRKLRRGEPTKRAKEQARIDCYIRALGFCELNKSPNCDIRASFGDGHLHHLKAKRRYGWRESEETGQRHLWSCPPCHAYHHAGGKPCPPKPR